MTQFLKDYMQVYRMEPQSHVPHAPLHPDEKISREIYNKALKLQCLYQKEVADAESRMLGGILKIFEEFDL